MPFYHKLMKLQIKDTLYLNQNLGNTATIDPKIWKIGFVGMSSLVYHTQANPSKKVLKRKHAT